MDVSAQRVLTGQFVKMVDRPDLRPGLPEQYKKNWENRGRTGTVQIFTVPLVDQPCEVTFSLFFDGEEVIQTGIRVKFRNAELINVVRKGDALDYQRRQRIDPVAFLKQHYGSKGLAQGGAESFTLAVDDDSEPQVWRAVQQLTGQTADAIKDMWQELINTNASRPGKDRVSPIIKTWLKSQRDKLDNLFLNDVWLLEPREQEITYFQGHGHNYMVVCKRVSGQIIRAKIDSADPEWWGGTYYAIRQGGLVRVPHDEKDRLKVFKAFDTTLDFPVEEIYVESRHVYSVVFVGEEALVWRTRDTMNPERPVYAPPEEPQKKGKFMGRFRRKEAEVVEMPEEEEPVAPAAPAVHPYDLAKAEKGYLEALQTRSAELNDRRQGYMRLLYASDVARFGNGPEELQIEMEGAVGQALKRDPLAMEREIALVRAHVMIFVTEQQG